MILAVWLEARLTQEADPRALSQPRLSRRRRLWRRRRRAPLFRQVGARTSRSPRRRRSPACSRRRRTIRRSIDPDGGGGARAGRARRHAATPATSPTAQASLAMSQPIKPGPRRRRRQRPLRRRLGDGRAAGLSSAAIDEDIVVDTTIDLGLQAAAARALADDARRGRRQVRRQPGRAWSPWTRAARSRRWSAGATMRRARSTAPSTPTASRARPSSPSSI